jgi:hypothetical protein
MLGQCRALTHLNLKANWRRRGRETRRSLAHVLKSATRGWGSAQRLLIRTYEIRTVRISAC